MNLVKGSKRTRFKDTGPYLRRFWRKSALKTAQQLKSAISPRSLT